MIEEIFEDARKISEQEDSQEGPPAYFKKEFTVKLTGEDLYMLKVGATYEYADVIDDIIAQAGDFEKE